MSITHSSSTEGKNTQRLKRASKSPRKPGVSPKFIKHIRNNAESQTSQGRKNQAR